MTRAADVATRVAERADVAWEEDPEGRVVVRRRKFGPVGSAVLRLVRIQPTLTVRLDAMGSEVWRLLDGTRTVAAVLAELQSEFPGEPDLADRLGQYLSSLAGNRLIRFR